MFEKYFKLNELNGSNGFLVKNLAQNKNIGATIAKAGDVNGDGIDDIVLGNPNWGNNAGASYVIFGHAGEFSASVDVNTLNGTDGFRIVGGITKNLDYLGYAVSSAGDINGDGRKDLLIGAKGFNTEIDVCSWGIAYVIYGQTHFQASININNNLNGTNGFMIPGYKVHCGLGFSVSSAGDVNGDGKDDFMLGAVNSQTINNGEGYVIFGRETFPVRLNLTTLTGKDGFVVKPIYPGGAFGAAVSSVGDINHDGKDDVILSAPYVNDGHGDSYVIYGQKEYVTPFYVANLNGTNGFRVTGLHTRDFLGAVVGGVGDINDDGIDDMAISASFANNGSKQGVVYIIFGGQPFPVNFDLNNLNGTNGFSIVGMGADAVLSAISGAGDINGDGKDDVILGSPGVNANSGESYVIYGQKSFPKIFDLRSLDGKNGFTILGSDVTEQLGFAVSSAGDINGDKINDIIIGSLNPGFAYVIFGKNPLRLVHHQVTILQNISVILDSTNFKAVDLNENAPQESLIFSIIDLQGGRFEFIDEANPMNRFSQKDILDKQVKFIQDGASRVSFGISVSNGFVKTVPEQANVILKFLPPYLTKNQITIIQGKPSVLTSENLSARDFNFPVDTLEFSVSNVAGGQFERVSWPGVSIKAFTQQDVIDQKIQFAQDNSKGAGYEVIVTDGNNLSSAPSKANVTFKASPILWNNQLFIKQRGFAILNRTNINTTDDTTPDSRLVITASNVKHGQFEYNNQPDVAIDHFTQENITQSAVRFKTDGGYEKPSYDLTVKDSSDLTDGPKAANITFHDAPQLVNNQLTIKEGQTVTLSRSDLSATEKYTPEENLLFNISDIEHGEFRIKNSSRWGESSSSMAVTQFFQQNVTDKKVQFVHDGSTQAPHYAVSVCDGELTSGAPENATIDFQKNSSVDNGLVIGCSVGAVGVAALVVAGFFAYKRYKGPFNPTFTIIGPTEKEQEIMEQDQQNPGSCQLF